MSVKIESKSYIKKLTLTTPSTSNNVDRGYEELKRGDDRVEKKRERHLFQH